MLSRFSVKKPYTVIVGIVLVIILGVVSLSKMSTDLLPSINLPYAIVVTTYPGASPEQVEDVVTQPIEGAMASTSPAMPAFQAKPRPTRRAERRWGRAADR